MDCAARALECGPNVHTTVGCALRSLRTTSAHQQLPHRKKSVSAPARPLRGFLLWAFTGGRRFSLRRFLGRFLRALFRCLLRGGLRPGGWLPHPDLGGSRRRGRLRNLISGQLRGPFGYFFTLVGNLFLDFLPFLPGTFFLFRAVIGV